MQLGSETQRVLRERLGAYDYYAVVEDDMVIYDPLFFEKLAWFEQQFGAKCLLQPLRYEMAQSGTPALISAWPRILYQPTCARLACGARGRPRKTRGELARQRADLHIANQPTRRGLCSSAMLNCAIGPQPPGCMTAKPRSVGPLESAMRLGLGRAFDVYQPAAPDPFFLSIEHWGTRYARQYAPAGVTYGDTPLLEIAHRALRRSPSPGATELDEGRAGLHHWAFDDGRPTAQRACVRARYHSRRTPCIAPFTLQAHQGADQSNSVPAAQLMPRVSCKLSR